MNQRARLFAYCLVSVRSMISRSLLIVGVCLMAVVGVLVGLFTHLANVNVHALLKSSSGGDLNIALVRLACVLMLFVLLNTIPGIMQNIITDKDTNIVAQIAPIVREKNYVLGKIVSALVLAIVSAINLVVAAICAVVTFELLRYHSVDFAPYLRAISPYFEFPVWLLVGASSVLTFLMLTLFAVILSGRINKAQEASLTALALISPLILAVVVLLLPLSPASLQTASSILSVLPLFSMIFFLVNWALNGWTAVGFVSLFLSLVYIYAFWRSAIYLYRYFLATEKTYSVAETIQLLVKRRRSRA